MNSSNCKVDGYLLDFLSEVISGDQSQKRVDTFYIVQMMASASSRIGSFAMASASASSRIGSFAASMSKDYCLEDLIDDDVARHAYDLPLVPLANGDFGFFFEASKGVSYFVCNELEYMLLQKKDTR